MLWHQPKFISCSQLPTVALTQLQTRTATEQGTARSCHGPGDDQLGYRKTSRYQKRISCISQDAARGVTHGGPACSPGIVIGIDLLGGIVADAAFLGAGHALVHRIRHGRPYLVVFVVPHECRTCRHERTIGLLDVLWLVSASSSNDQI